MEEEDQSGEVRVHYVVLLSLVGSDKSVAGGLGGQGTYVLKSSLSRDTRMVSGTHYHSLICFVLVS